MINRLLTFCTSIVLFLGCQGKQGPVGALLSGDIIGSVQVYNTTGNNTYRDRVLIQLEGTQYSTYSGSDGLWKLTGVQTGTYVIACSKPGYSTSKNTSFQFVGGNQPADGGFFQIYQLPLIFVKSISISQANENFLVISGRLSSKLIGYNTQPIFTYVGLDSNATSLSNKYLTYINIYVSAPDSFKIEFDFSALRAVGAVSGTKIYFVSYTIASLSAAYYDITKRTTVYTGLCLTPSNIVGYIVP